MSDKDRTTDSGNSKDKSAGDDRRMRLVRPEPDIWDELEAVRRERAAYWEGSSVETNVPPRATLVATEPEMAAARLTARCIVEDYLYADVGQLFAPGGTSKTTLLLFEAIHIALGLPLWGLRVESPGWTLFVTKEDSREMLLARLRELMHELGLNDVQRRKVMTDVLIWDLSDSRERLVRMVGGQHVEYTDLPERIVAEYRDDPPAQVIFDPLVSFGASEGLVNDNMQAVIEASRVIRNGLDCCVRFSHHVSKASATKGHQKVGMHDGRSGSALADGTRMTASLWLADISATPPPGCRRGGGADLLVLQRHKCSYAKRGQPVLWIRRDGWQFEHFVEPRHVDPQVEMDAFKAQIENWLDSQAKSGRFWTRTMIKENHGRDPALPTNMTRDLLIAVLNALELEGRTTEIKAPEPLRIRRRQTVLCTTRLARERGWSETVAPTA